jgi:hypothetical protein
VAADFRDALAGDAVAAAVVDAPVLDAVDATALVVDRRALKTGAAVVGGVVVRAAVRYVVSVDVLAVAVAGEGMVGREVSGPGCWPSFVCSRTQNVCQLSFASRNNIPCQSPLLKPVTQARASPLK